MSYLERQTLTLVLRKFKIIAEGQRSGESDNDAVHMTQCKRMNLLICVTSDAK